MRLTQQSVYPIKSMGGLDLPAWKILAGGLEFDRNWMLVDGDGNFLTQREIPQMTLMRMAFQNRSLQVFSKTNPSEKLELPLLAPTHPETVKIKIWDDETSAYFVGNDADNWFGERLGQPCRLVRIAEVPSRKSIIFPKEGKAVAFADSQPILVIGQATLDFLNSKLNAPVPMERFRPNFVFSGGQPFEEDSWSGFTIGNASFSMVKPCARCVMTTIDQQTAESGKEPLRALNEFRKFENKTLFGMYAKPVFEPGQVHFEVKTGEEVLPVYQ